MGPLAASQSSAHTLPDTGSAVRMTNTEALTNCLELTVRVYHGRPELSSRTLRVIGRPAGPLIEIPRLS